MIVPLAPALRAVTERLPASLVGVASREILLDLAKRLPAVMTSFGFECRLRAGSDDVDLGFPVEPGAGRDRLAGLASGGADEADAWQRIGALCRRWADPDSAMHDWVPFLCFEVDAARAGEELPTPSVFVTLDSPLAPPADSRVRSRPEFQAMREAIPILAGAALPEDLEANLVSCFANLPGDARALHAGVMLSRRLEGVRLSVVARPAEVVPYLLKCGWFEGTFEVEDLLLRYVAPGESVQFDFDIGAAAILPRLGIGLAPRDEEGWARLLDRLVEDDLCTRSKGADLLAWPGAAMTSLGGRACVLRRALSHVKLSCGPGHPREAKAYFGVTPVASLFR